MDIDEGLTTTEATCGKVGVDLLPPRIRTMHAHFRTLSLLTLSASMLLGACTIIEDPVTPINPPARREPAPPPASPPPPAEPGVAVPAPPVVTPATPAEPGVAVPAPPVATPVPGTTAEPPVQPTTPIGPAKPKRPIMKIPHFPARPRPAPGTEPKAPGRDVSPAPPKRPPVEAAPAGNGRADGTACSTSSQCASGICEGMGCGWDQGKCAPAQRSCTRDLRIFCGCDGKDFQSSSTCPGRVFRHPGSCNPQR